VISEVFALELLGWWKCSRSYPFTAILLVLIPKLRHSKGYMLDRIMIKQDESTPDRNDCWCVLLAHLFCVSKLEGVCSPFLDGLGAPGIVSIVPNFLSSLAEEITFRFSLWSRQELGFLFYGFLGEMIDFDKEYGKKEWRQSPFFGRSGSFIETDLLFSYIQIVWILLLLMACRYYYLQLAENIAKKWAYPRRFPFQSLSHREQQETRVSWCVARMRHLAPAARFLILFPELLLPYAWQGTKADAPKLSTMTVVRTDKLRTKSKRRNA
jgi:hypothetical protein